MRAGFNWTILAGVPAVAFAAVLFFGIKDDWCCTPPERVEAVWVSSTARVALWAFHVHTGRNPTTEEGLAALVDCPSDLRSSWRGPYFEPPTVPLDHWRREYRYRCPGAHNPDSYDVWSLGPDGVESADDIGNW